MEMTARVVQPALAVKNRSRMLVFMQGRVRLYVKTALENSPI